MYRNFKEIDLHMLHKKFQGSLLNGSGEVDL